MDESPSVSTLGSETSASEEREAYLAALTELQGDFGALQTAFLDGLLEHLRCERALLLRWHEPLDAAGTAPRFEVACARTVVSRNLTGEIVVEDQAAPEFVVEGSVVRRAVQSDVAVADRNCLVEVPPPGAEVRRTVLCHAFPWAPGELGAVYLDAPVVSDGALDALRGDFEALLRTGLPILRSVRLECALLELRARLDGTETAPRGGEDEDASETGEATWAFDDEIPIYHGMVGKSDRLLKIFEMVEKIKDTDFNVCLFGESGCGKEILARAIHDAGKRRGQEFISENCGAISETLLESELFGHVKGSFTGADETRKGLFELADRGTLFLDEIGDMSEGMQRKLLRVLQEGVIRPIGSKDTIRVNVRVICASNRDLKVLMERGAFREDLYYRLNVISIELPPLRERIEDIPYLTKWILKGLDGPARRLSHSAMNALMSYSWPGNVRELTNILQRLVVTGSRRVVTRKEVLPLLSRGPARSYVSDGLDDQAEDSQIVLRIPQRQTFNEIIAECEKAVLLNALKENRWNKSRVTKVLQIPRQSLYNKIAKYELKRKGKSG